MLLYKFIKIMNNILIIVFGSREHCIADILSNYEKNNVYVLKGNSGMNYFNPNIKLVNNIDVYNQDTILGLGISTSEFEHKFHLRPLATSLPSADIKYLYSKNLFKQQFPLT